MSFYVHRAKEDRTGWIGPIRSKTQAIKEAQAWQDSGWDAVVFVSDPSIKRAVAMWQKQADARLGRRRRALPGS